MRWISRRATALWPLILLGAGLPGAHARSGEAARTVDGGQEESAVRAAWEQAMTAAKEAKKARDWGTAASAYERALTLAGTLADDSPLIQAADAKAGFHRERWEYPEAIAACERLLSAGAERWELLWRSRSCQWSLAELYETVEAFEEAEALRRARLEHLETADRPTRSDLVRRTSELARLLMKIRPEDGEIETLLLAARNLAPAGEAERRALSDLGLFYAERGRHEEARDALGASLARLDESDPSQQSMIVYLEKKLAAELESLGDFDGAERRLRSALARDESRLGEDHFRVADSLYRLGRFLANRERLYEAEPHLRRAVELNAAAVGDDHPGYDYLRRELRRVLVALGRDSEGAAGDTRAEPPSCDCPPGWQRARALQREGRTQEALALLAAGLAQAERDYGEDSLAVAAALNEIGRLHWSKQPVEAIAAYERRLAILAPQVEATDPRVVDTASRLGYLYAVTRDYDQAVAYTRLEVDSLRRRDEATVQLAEALADLGRRHDEAGRPSEAIEYHQLAAEMWSALAGEGCREQIRALGALGWSYVRAERHDEAEELLLGLIAFLEAREPADEFGLSSAWNALVRLYDETAREAEAREARARAAGR